MAQVDINANVANGGRRFTLTVESVSPMLDGNGLLVSGNLHGTVKKGDTVYSLLPDKITETTVLGIESVVEDKLKVSDEATDTRVNLQLAIANPADVKILSVVTSIHPVEELNPNIPMENPYLAGILYEAERFKDDKNYLIILSYLLTKGKFLVPLKVAQQEENQSPKMGFYLLPASRPAEGETPSKFYFPTFTDFEELSKWTALTKENPKVPTTVMNFAQLSDMTKPEPTTGIIINPFSKNMIIIRQELIDSIVKSEGFKKEFNL